MVNRELAVIIKARAASRAGQTAMTVTCVCSRIALDFDRLHCFKSDADWSAQIKHNFMRSADGVPMLLQLIIH